MESGAGDMIAVVCGVCLCMCILHHCVSHSKACCIPLSTPLWVLIRCHQPVNGPSHIPNIAARHTTPYIARQCMWHVQYNKCAPMCVGITNTQGTFCEEHNSCRCTDLPPRHTWQLHNSGRIQDTTGRQPCPCTVAPRPCCAHLVKLVSSAMLATAA